MWLFWISDLIDGLEGEAYWKGVVTQMEFCEKAVETRPKYMLWIIDRADFALTL